MTKVGTGLGIPKPKKAAERLIAKKLFVEDGKTAVEISEWLGVSQHALSKWRTADKWETARVEFASRPENLERQVMKNLELLSKAFETAITEGDYKKQGSIGANISFQNKLMLTLRKDGRPSTLHTIRTLEDFMNFLRTRNPELLVQLTPVAREFVQSHNNE